MLREARQWWIILLCVIAAVLIIRKSRGSFDLGNHAFGFMTGAAAFRLRRFLGEPRLYAFGQPHEAL